MDEHGHEHELPADVREADREGEGGYFYRPGEILVTAEDAPLVQERLGRRKAERREDGPVVRFVLPDEDITELVEELRQPVKVREHEWRVPAVGPNHVLVTAGHMLFAPAIPPEPADPRPPLPRGEHLAGRGARVGVVDTGIVEHDWLQGRVDPQSEAEALPAGELEPSTGHGTFVAGTVLLHAPGATVVAMRVDAANGFTDDLSVAAAIERCPDVDVLCLPLGGFTHDDMELPATAAALDRLWRRRPGTAVVASAGNHGSNRPFLPAALKHVIGVTSVDAAGNRSWFSNHGPWVDAAAPGEGVHSTYVPVGPFKEWATWSGTSFAAPRVAGLIASIVQPGFSAAEAAFRLVGAPSVPRVEGLGAVLDPPELA